MDIKNIGQLLQHLASKAGVAKDDQNLINALSSSELSKITIHSDLVKAIDENLLSIEAAKDNHSEISSVYKAQALNQLDKRVLAIAEDLGLEDDEIAELKKTTNSYKKLEVVIGKLKDSKKAEPNKADKDALQIQIDGLLKDLKEAKDSVATKETEFNSKLTAEKIGFELKSKLAGKKTIFDTLDSNIRYKSLMSVIDNALQDKDAEMSFDEKGNLQILKKDGTRLLGANHTQISIDDLVDSTLAHNKILQVAAPPKDHAQKQEVIIPGGKATDEISGTNQSITDFNIAQLETATA
jgi:hypothetical protein